MTNQPVWKLEQEYDAERLYVDETGVYDAELEILEQDFEEGIGYLFRVSLEPSGLVEWQGKEYITNKNWQPNWMRPGKVDPSDWEPWWLRKLDDVAATTGHTRAGLEALAVSSAVFDLLELYRCLIGHFGPGEFDQYPNTLGHFEVENYLDSDWEPDEEDVYLQVQTNYGAKTKLAWSSMLAGCELTEGDMRVYATKVSPKMLMAMRLEWLERATLLATRFKHWSDPMWVDDTLDPLTWVYKNLLEPRYEIVQAYRRANLFTAMSTKVLDTALAMLIETEDLIERGRGIDALLDPSEVK